MDKWSIYCCQQVIYMCLPDTGMQHSLKDEPCVSLSIWHARQKVTNKLVWYLRFKFFQDLLLQSKHLSLKLGKTRGNKTEVTNNKNFTYLWLVLYFHNKSALRNMHQLIDDFYRCAQYLFVCSCSGCRVNLPAHIFFCQWHFSFVWVVAKNHRFLNPLLLAYM